MSLYENWIQAAYTEDGKANTKFWEQYSPKEKKVYETILENKITNISGTVTEFANTYDLPVEWAIGYLDGISGALTEEFDASKLEADTEINANIDFEMLYKKMVEFKAEYLYTLPQWNNIYNEEEQKKLYTEQKRSTTIVKSPKVGRNDPCMCGSGKKYKKCCGA